MVGPGDGLIGSSPRTWGTRVDEGPPITARGSSPRTWGTRRTREGLTSQQRFIPTHVGNTPRRARRPSAKSVHPHARGEHDRLGRHVTADNGSSPRTWGTRGQGHDPERQIRFIPTHVGNTQNPCLSWRLMTVHPHARGEHSVVVPAYRPSTGSSPRTWGTPHDQDADSQLFLALCPCLPAPDSCPLFLHEAVLVAIRSSPSM